jgi:hypothetical protein
MEGLQSIISGEMPTMDNPIFFDDWAGIGRILFGDARDRWRLERVQGRSPLTWTVTLHRAHVSRGKGDCFAVG